MRILVHGIDFSPEEVGTGKYTGEMAQWLAMHGHDVRVITTAPHYPQWKVFEGYSSWRFTWQTWTSSNSNGSLSVTRCPVWIPRNPRGWRRILYLASFAISSFFPMLLQILWSPRLVLLVQPTVVCAPHVLSIAALTSANAWLHIQDFEVEAAFQVGGLSSTRLRRIALRLEHFLNGKFDRVSTISPRMLERLAQKGVKRSRSVLFPNWVDTSAIYPLPRASALRQELRIPETAIVALYSGSMGAKHGLNLLIEASRRLATRRDIYFVFCGDGPYRETLRVEQNANVILLPLQPTKRLNELLNLADMHLLPQASEASDLVMPSKLTGMMASGRPVIATAQAGTQLSRVLAERGIVTPPEDIEAFITAIVEVAEDADLRRRMGEASRQYAVDHMNQHEILSQFEASIQELCSVTSCSEGELPIDA
jgi:colanic acid biosynthesis glycosyl transferase WcaI